MNKNDTEQPSSSLEDTVSSTDALIDKIHSSFSKGNRERIARELVSEVLSNLELSTSVYQRTTPRLLIHRLVFTGEKTLHSEDKPCPFRYEQKFFPGVNVLLIPDNNVGKSSVMKTIKFALTGDDSDYDDDVKAWIQRIWLQFSVGAESFTSYIIRESNRWRGILVFGKEERDLEELSEIPGMLFDVTGSDNLRTRLQLFFFERLGISALSWTQKNSSVSNGVAERSASWKTFFQAMFIPDSSDQYLLCDPQHAMGNQEGLIFSVFLGLQLIEPLNRLGVETSLTKKQNKLNEEEIQQAQKEINCLNAELAAVQEQINAIKTERHSRLQALRTEEPTQRLSVIGSRLVENLAEKDQIEEQRGKLSKEIQRLNARARGVREAIAYKLHFTGLEVLLCPNCDSTVDEEAILQEQQTHVCRLCNKPAPAASAEELDDLKLQALDFEKSAQTSERTRAGLRQRLRELQQEREALEKERDTLREVTERGIEIVVPSQEEETLLSDLYQQVGQLRGQIATVNQRATVKRTSEDETDIRLRVMVKAREVLREEASRLNQSLLDRLSARTQELSKIIGVESITDVSCSPLGQVQLCKHNVQVRFTSIRNPGERLRVKLAFYLAMMRIGREPAKGRHPGLLLIDQLGSAEMIEDDCRTLAHVLHQLDMELSSEVQVICFTARSEFAEATDPAKVYGSQSGRFAF